jgi:hypothetical protein
MLTDAVVLAVCALAANGDNINAAAMSNLYCMSDLQVDSSRYRSKCVLLRGAGLEAEIRVAQPERKAGPPVPWTSTGNKSR